MHRHGICLVWAVSLVVGLVQGGVSRAQDSDTAVFRSTTRLVQLNVVVLDKHRQPVTNLSRDDFQVFDNGREQKLVHFSTSLSGSLSTVPAPTAAPAKSPLVIANRPEGQSTTPVSKTVILVDETIDQDATAFALRAMMLSVRLEILKFLGTLQPGDQVALYALHPQGVVVVHDFTDDPEELLAAAKTLGSRLLKSRTPGSSDIGSPSRDVASSNDLSRRAYFNEDLRRALAEQAFQSISLHLEGLPGRKNVVWISPAFPSMVSGLDINKMSEDRDAIVPIAGQPLPVPDFSAPEGHYEQLRAFARRLSSTNISVYPIDPRGLIGAGDSAASGPLVQPTVKASETIYPPPTVPDRGPRNANPQVVNNSKVEPALPMISVAAFSIGPWATMDLIASETGGRAFYNTNGLSQILREVVDQNRVAYLLGYYPGDAAWDGRYHHIVLKLKREGLSALCRRGYFATDEPVLPYQDSVLRTAARSTLDASAIGVTLNVPSNPLEWFQQEVVVKLDAQDIQFEENAGRWNAEIEIVFAQLNKDGRVLDSDKDHLELALYPETYANALAQGWLYPKVVDVDPQAAKVRVVVRDLATGAIGTASVPVRQEKRR